MFPEWMRKSTMMKIEATEETDGYQAYQKKSYERYLVIEQQASTHISWFTHRNPYGCWICDLLQLTKYALAALEDTSRYLEERTVSTAPVVDISVSSHGTKSDEYELDKLKEP